MTIEERIKACLSRHPGWDDHRVRNAIAGSNVDIVRAVREGKPAPPAMGDAPKKQAVKTISLVQVRERYDMAAAIRREVAQFAPGELVLERDLAALAAGRDFNRFRRAVDNNLEEFKKHRVKLNLPDDPAEGRYYWADAKTIAAAIRERDKYGR